MYGLVWYGMVCMYVSGTHTYSYVYGYTHMYMRTFFNYSTKTVNYLRLPYISMCGAIMIIGAIKGL